MRLQNFILNEGKPRSASKNDAVNFCQKNCQKFIKAGNYNIFRGYNKPSELFLIMDPSQGDSRKSTSGYEYTALLIDNLPSWKQYPKRSRSVICTSSKSESKEYGASWRVIPSDNCTFGVCPTFDMWLSFDKIMGRYTTVHQFNIALSKNQLSDKDWPSFKKDMIEMGSELTDSGIFNKLTRSILGGSYEKLIRLVFDDFIKSSNKNIIEWLDDFMSPEKNGFSTDITKAKKNSEIWIGSGPVLLVLDKEFDTFVKEL